MRLSPISLADAAKAETLVIPLFSKQSLGDEEIFSLLSKETGRSLLRLHKDEFTGEEGEARMLWQIEGMPRRIILFGCGKRSEWRERKAHILPRRIVQYLKQQGYGSAAVLIGPHFGPDMERAAALFAANALLADFEFVRYKTFQKEERTKLSDIFPVVDRSAIKKFADGIRLGTVVAEETNLCRELANTPGSDMTPAKLAEEAVGVMRRVRGVRATTLDEAAMHKLGMGGILGVARGSAEKPRLIILEYGGGRKGDRPLVLVGKGVTFDSGGINLKPANALNEMHMDMSGGAAVIHGIAAIARLKIPVTAIGIVPAVENMPSGSSYRPGDVLRTMSGKTIEVLNTDAEGRVILSDALWYGATKYNPGLMVDFATLTGAAMVALGTYCSAAFARESDPALMDKLVAVGAASGDYVWPLPLWDEYLADIKGTFGDIANDHKTGGRYGGAIHGAKFLEQFTNNVRWAHIDIAPRMTANDADFLSKGATGAGVRFMVELARRYPEIQGGDKKLLKKSLRGAAATKQSMQPLTV
ncbi:MAG: leucyl aminopeptidase [Patescibacteria group bacterium]